MSDLRNEPWVVNSVASEREKSVQSVKGGTLRERNVILPVFLAELTKRTYGEMNYDGRFKMARDLSPSFDQGTPPNLFGLKPITLSEAVQSVNKVHTGCVMFLKTVQPAFSDVCTALLAEDSNSDVAVLNLYNYLSPHENPQEALPAASFLAILEPTLVFEEPDVINSVILRYDNPQFVLMFSSEEDWKASQNEDFTQGEQMEVCYDDINKHGFSEVIADAYNKSEELCDKGNAYFKYGKYKTALREYTKGLQLHPTGTRLLSNRALVYMRMQCWPEALEDLERALIIDREHLKVRFRHCTVLLHLQRAKEAQNLLQKLIYDLEDYHRPKGDLNAAKALMELVKRALLELKGKYDFKALRKEANNVPGQVRRELPRTHMDYRHPQVEVCPATGDKGRGVFATKYTRHSTLILAEKALVFLPGPSPTHVADQPLPMDRLQYHAVVRDNLLPRVVQKLIHHPEIGAGLYSLSDGERYSDAKSQEDLTLVDLPRIRRILQVNHISPNHDQFANYLSSPQRNEAGDSVNAMVDLNLESVFGGGLWVNPSLFNHSCAPNCAFFVIGDFCFVTTTRDIKPNEELTVPYCSGHLTYTERQHALLTRLDKGFCCQCERCAYTAEHPEHTALEQEVDAYLAAGLEEDKGYPVEPRNELIARLQGLPSLQQGSLIPLLHLQAIHESARLHDEEAALQLHWQQLQLMEDIFGLPFNSSAYMRHFLPAVSSAIHMGEFIQAEKFIRRLFEVFVEVPWALLDRVAFLHLWQRDCAVQTLTLVEVIVDNVVRGRSMCSHAGAAFAVSEVADRLRHQYGYGSSAATEEKKID